MNYIAQHRVNIQNRLTTTRSSLQKGMIVQCQYTGKNDQGPRMYLILNPLYDGLVHALDLNDVPVVQFVKLAEQVGVAFAIGPKFKKVNIDKLLIGENKRFYNGTLKRLLKNQLTGSYRTLTPTGLSNIQVINYKFPKTVTIING